MGASNGWGTDPANQIRGYRNEVRLHGLQGLQPAAAGFVSVAAVSTAAPPTVGCAQSRSPVAYCLSLIQLRSVGFS
jgi:hypothetical protein